jgi:hypothetical protein
VQTLAPPPLVLPTVDQDSEQAQTPFGVGDAILLTLAALAIALFIRRGWYRLDAVGPRPRSFAPITGWGLWLAMFALGVAGSALARIVSGIQIPADGRMPDLTVPQLAQMALGCYAAQSIGLGVYAWLRWHGQPPSAMVDPRLGRLRAALIAPATLLLAWPVVLVAANLAAWVGGEPVDQIAHETLRTLIKSDLNGWSITLGLLVVLAGPVMEEVTYRGLLQESLAQSTMPRWSAVGLTSVVFALMHGGIAEPYALPALFVLSVALGWAYEKTGRLITPIIMHMLFNAGNLGLAVVMSKQTAS